jgi:bifunctional DNA primase/polymerase-like protein
MSPVPVPKMDSALETSRRGARVYPLAPNSDEPAFPEADCCATTDESQVLEWWREDPDRNVGIATDYLLALHVTTADGANSLNEIMQNMPGPAAVKTTRLKLDGDRSYALFSLPKGATVPCAADILPGVSVLSSDDDVIVGPGSVVNGIRCSFANDRPIAPAPEYLMKLCGVQPREPTPCGGSGQARRQSSRSRGVVRLAVQDRPAGPIQGFPSARRAGEGEAGSQAWSPVGGHTDRIVGTGEVDAADGVPGNR